MGYTTNDATLTNTGDGVDRFTNGGPKYAGLTNTADEVGFNSTGTTTIVTRVGYRVEINAAQPAGAYTGTVLLVATPTY